MLGKALVWGRVPDPGATGKAAGGPVGVAADLGLAGGLALAAGLDGGGVLGLVAVPLA